MNFQRGRYKEEPEINLVPLIDVMMVILIFLMITTTYSKYTELQINLPTADAEKQLERPGEVSVLVDARGQYVINKAPIEFASIEQLAGALRSAGAGLREPIVIISADAAATHQSVIRVMEASRLAGLSQITFTTQASRQSTR
jgi:biopolymer transport protein ExbD